MTKGTTRQRSPRKTAASRQAAPATRAPDPMDATITEATEPPAIAENASQPRQCWAMVTLIEEVVTSFPETSWETGDLTHFGSALDVVFTGYTDAEPSLPAVLSLIETDFRVAEVDLDSRDQQVLVVFHADFTTKDSREPFGLAEALAVMNGERDG